MTASCCQDSLWHCICQVQHEDTRVDNRVERPGACNVQYTVYYTYTNRQKRRSDRKIEMGMDVVPIFREW